jgi:SnoaL-like domain
VVRRRNIRSDEYERGSIVLLLLACFNASDRGDDNTKDKFFVSDARMQSNDDITNEVRGLEALSAKARSVSASFQTTHTMSNIDVVQDGRKADAVTYAIVHIMPRNEPLIIIRSMRYDDRLVLTSAGWRIAERRHSVLWQYEVAAHNPRSLSDDAPTRQL